MSGRNRTSKYGPYAVDSRSPDGIWQLSPDERMIEPRRAGRIKRAIVALVFITLMLGGFWVWVFDRTLLSAVPAAEIASAWTSVTDRLASAPIAVKPPASSSGPVVEPVAEVATRSAEPAMTAQGETPREQPVAPEASITTAALPAPASVPSEQPEPLARPPATDPRQKRAEAAGLHPDLSPVLLDKLSATDYRNAAVAIKTAMAETADTDTFAWPKERKAGLAHFMVRFVPGATPDCRRYVVTVLKSGWTTTALPMERCGAQRRAAGR